jgi:hypothetical protein
MADFEQVLRPIVSRYGARRTLVDFILADPTPHFYKGCGQGRQDLGL